MPFRLKPPTIIVTPLSHLEERIAQDKPSTVIALMSPHTEYTRPKSILAEQYLCLSFHDIVAPRETLIVPTAEHVAILLQFALSRQYHGSILIHCLMGVSRSTAAAYTIACALHPQISELSLAQHLRQQAPFATPNAKLIHLADQQLGRKGRMEAAIASIGRGCEIKEGCPFSL